MNKRLPGYRTWKERSRRRTALECWNGKKRKKKKTPRESDQATPYVVHLPRISVYAFVTSTRRNLSSCDSIAVRLVDGIGVYVWARVGTSTAIWKTTRRREISGSNFRYRAKEREMHNYLFLHDIFVRSEHTFTARQSLRRRRRV